MDRRALFASLVTAGAALGQRRGGAPPETAPLANSEEEKRILAVLDEARRTGDVYLEVPVVDGRMLRVLAETANAKQVVEIGTSTGYSGLWFTLALRKTGGRLTTFELDAGRAARARKHFEQAGVANLVTLIEGDAHKNVPKLKGAADVVFIDADKAGYVDYLKSTLPTVRPGGLILAHNIEMVPNYVKSVTTDPSLETVFYMQGGGLGITVKKL
jgi:predicted O-methyltransferase YrrM